MITHNMIIGALLLLSVATLFTVPKFRDRLRAGGEYFVNAITAVNIFADGRMTFLADASFTARYLICKAGSDVNHINICTASDVPLGVVPDMTPTADQAASDLSYPLPVNLLCGAMNETQRMVASGAISVGDFVSPDAAGKVKTEPATTGTYYVIGRALTAASSNNDLINVAPLFYKDRVP